MPYKRVQGFRIHSLYPLNDMNEVIHEFTKKTNYLQKNQLFLSLPLTLCICSLLFFLLLFNSATALSRMPTKTKHEITSMLNCLPNVKVNERHDCLFFFHKVHLLFTVKERAPTSICYSKPRFSQPLFSQPLWPASVRATTFTCLLGCGICILTGGGRRWLTDKGLGIYMAWWV